jgi:hypothetical protein
VDDVGTGAFKYLGTFSSVTSLLGAFSSGDSNPANAGKPWLFTDTAGQYTTPGVLTTVEGSSSSAITLSDFGGWSLPEPYATSRFRRLRVDMWVDPQRDANQNVTETSSITTNRANSLFNAVHRVLQRRDSDTIQWGDLVTFACQLLVEPQFVAVPDGGGMQLGTAFYGVSLTGWTDVAS